MNATADIHRPAAPALYWLRLPAGDFTERLAALVRIDGEEPRAVVRLVGGPDDGRVVRLPPAWPLREAE